MMKTPPLPDLERGRSDARSSLAAGVVDRVLPDAAGATEAGGAVQVLAGSHDRRRDVVVDDPDRVAAAAAAAGAALAAVAADSSVARDATAGVAAKSTKLPQLSWSTIAANASPSGRDVDIDDGDRCAKREDTDACSTALTALAGAPSASSRATPTS
jgi:hypothetical protein